jgi:hypothetical protein
MHDSVFMHVGQTLQKSLHECLDFQFGKASFVLNLIEFLPSEFCGKVARLTILTLRRKLNSKIQKHFQVSKCSGDSGFS